MAEKEDQAPKIIVDDDWKAQAQAEKERLAEELDKGAAKTGQAQAGPHELPPPDFTTLVNSIATRVVMALGALQDRESGKPMVDLDVAKHHVDTLAMLDAKTAGNLTDDEKRLLDQVLYQTRMEYVQVAQSGRG